jgi:hypothetical protein
MESSPSSSSSSFFSDSSFVHSAKN